MDSDWSSIIARIHDSGHGVVMAVTGGGSAAISALLAVPGASRTLLEAVVPYDHRALADLLGIEPEHASSAETAAAMAERAYRRAERLADPGGLLVGLGLTASLASDRPKRGAHRCHIATVTAEQTELLSVVFVKGLRSRAEEEEVTGRVALAALAVACGVAAPDPASLLAAGDVCTRHRGGTGFAAPSLLGRLVRGEVDRVTVLRDGQCRTGADAPAAVLPGSFDPLHAGHLALARVASEILGVPVAFELSVLNVDKPSLGEAELRRRLEAFGGRATIELTRAAGFVDKARLMPGAAFVVGADTAERIVSPRYYGGSEQAMHAALADIAALGSSFLVAGRVGPRGQFRTLSDLDVPARVGGLFRAIPAAQFRLDRSSTDLRGRA